MSNSKEFKTNQSLNHADVFQVKPDATYYDCTNFLKILLRRIQAISLNQTLCTDSTGEIMIEGHQLMTITDLATEAEQLTAHLTKMGYCYMDAKTTLNMAVSHRKSKEQENAIH